ncbi:P-loop containing nucleoside triphosphate hydrolase protein [Scenedesmus sp. NREL 46B-D3]|nr:P-loop containing nucleoside triphosphate hydrolase protein [Scenedesmus sp. NREL 46B-D3]
MSTVADGRTAGTAGPPQPVLPWMRLPISIPTGSGVPLEQVHGLHPALRQAVGDCLGFTELFPVQAAVWRGLAGGHSTCHDMCICAPTGSGKTLAYALPLLNAVCSSAHPHKRQLAGLVVLPTRDLAVQVHRVLAALGTASGVAVALAAAQESVAAEAAGLVSRPSQPASGPQLLVATPGRLMAHLQGTAGFSLAGLRFLVVDEADRLLRQDYQGWLPEVLRQINTHGSSHQQQHQWQAHLQQPDSSSTSTSTTTTSSSSTFLSPLLPCSGSSSSSSSPRLLKLVVSATLTRDPSKLLRLELHYPRYITLAGVMHRYAVPAQLSQWRLVVPAQHKPLALLGLLHQLAGSSTIVFASSLETTHRLYLMLAAVPGLPDKVAEYSSQLPPEQRAASLAAFRSGAARVLVTSDAMARGMDVASVANVINYDPPVYPKTYVHRAGRTARAGQAGAVYTLLKPEDVVHFNGMASKLQGGKVQQMRLQQAQLQLLRPALQDALLQVQQLLQHEKQEQEQRQRQRTEQKQQGQRPAQVQRQQKRQLQVPSAPGTGEVAADDHDHDHDHDDDDAGSEEAEAVTDCADAAAALEVTSKKGKAKKVKRSHDAQALNLRL